MKKTNAILTAVALSGVFASASFAGTIISSTTIGGGVYTPSTKVGINVKSALTSYAATSAHLNGSFQYGTGGGSAYAGDASKILQKAYTATSGDTVGIPEVPTDATTLANISTWK